MSEFAVGHYVRKKSGAFWEGTVVGHYSTEQTPDGVAVQLFGWSDGPVQIYPAAALELCCHSGSRLPTPPSTHVRVTGFRGNPLRVVLSNGEEATISQKLIDSFTSPSPFEQHPDDIAVDRFAAAMKAKLAKKRGEGFGGWDDPGQCHIDYLHQLLQEQFHERSVIDPIDIANLAMMIHERTPSND